MNNNLIKFNNDSNITKQNVIELFLANKRSYLTRKCYRTDIFQFLSYSKLNSIEDLLNLDYSQVVKLVIDFRNSITKLNSDNLPTNLNTVARKLYSLKAFFKFLVKSRIIFDNPLAAVDNVITPNEGTTNALTLSELKSIFSEIDKNTVLGKRNRAIIQLLYHCALRRNSVATLKLSNITYENDTPVLKFIGKRMKYMLIPLKAEVIEAVREYLNFTGRELNPNSDEYVFHNHSNYQVKGMGHISSEAIYKLVIKYAAKAKISKKITPHSLRVSSVTISLDNNASYRSIQNLTGHANISMVAYYDRGDKLRHNATFALPSLS